MSAPLLPMVLRKDHSLVLAVYSEAAASVTELDGDTRCYTGDYRECEIVFNPARPTFFAHATTTTLTYTEVVETDAAAGEEDPRRFSFRTIFAVPMSHTAVGLAFSPKGTYLVTYAMMDPRRTPDGNLSVFDSATGKLLRRGMQARWPAMIWTADESYVVRPVQGWLHTMSGDLAASALSTDLSGDANGAGGEDTDDASTTAAAAAAAAAGGPLSKLDLMLAQDKEIEFATAPADGRPMLALFKPFYKQRQATFAVYRLPQLREGPLYSVNLGRAEAATLLWSPSGAHVAVLVQSERDPSGKSYYGTAQLLIIDAMNRTSVDVKLKGEGETVHDCQWSPTSDELLVVHGKMPRNKCTLFNKSGVALVTFGEAPRNMAAWAPNGTRFVVGGSGNLAGDFQFYNRPQMMMAAAGGGAGSAAAVAVASTATCTGEFNEKCSFQTWGPDSYTFLCSTVFTRLRMDNKIVVAKVNGTRVLTQRYPVLYGAHWVAMRAPQAYAPRTASPRTAGEEKPKAQAYRPPGGTSRASALLRREPEAPQQAKSAGPVGSTVVTQKKKRRH
ncbi:Eukaryotic translation initiation factor eIF2A [Novymonas esmeraldas]|uniref:Eukaryotic translation initiation factor eIF2A n=1 Tax=Novymonas esmeraldas TaxID=1808958 RepID=A0AAW0EMG0_9TRYP